MQIRNNIYQTRSLSPSAIRVNYRCPISLETLNPRTDNIMWIEQEFAQRPNDELLELNGVYFRPYRRESFLGWLRTKNAYVNEPVTGSPLRPTTAVLESTPQVFAINQIFAQELRDYHFPFISGGLSIEDVASNFTLVDEYDSSSYFNIPDEAPISVPLSTIRRLRFDRF